MTFPPKPTDFKVTENQVILNKPDFYFEIIILRNMSRVKRYFRFKIYFNFRSGKSFFIKAKKVDLGESRLAWNRRSEMGHVAYIILLAIWMEYFGRIMGTSSGHVIRKNGFLVVKLP